MSALQDQFRVTWQRWSTAFVNLLDRIESTPQFESLLAQWENQSLEKQKAIRSIVITVVGLVLLLIIVWPILTIADSASRLSQMQSLLVNMHQFNNEKDIAVKKGPNPSDWKSMNFQNAEDLESVLASFIYGISLDPNQNTLSTSGNTIRLDLKELNIRQASTILYQLDGLYSRVKIIESKIEVHPTQKDLLTMQLELEVTNEESHPAAAGAQSLGDSLSRPGAFESAPNMDFNSGSGAEASTSSGSSSESTAPAEEGDYDFLDQPNLEELPPGSDFEELPPPPGLIED